MKKCIFFVLAFILITETRLSNAQHTAFIKGQDLLDWITIAEAKDAKPSADQAFAGLRAQGYVMGIADYLVVMNHVCLPPNFRFASLQPIIKRELALNHAKFLQGSGATYVENAILKTYPCGR